MINELNREFAIEEHISFQTGEDGLPKDGREKPAYEVWKNL